jgi:hydrogenase-4 component E
MPSELYQQLIATTSGVLLLTAILQVWGRSLARSIWLLAVQGLALAGLALSVGLEAGESSAFWASGLVLVVKVVVLPQALLRSAKLIGQTREQQLQVNTAVELLGAAGLTVLGYVVSAPLMAAIPGPAGQAIPVGISLVLLGFWQLLIRRSAIAGLIGFLIVDNGIATVAFLASGGLPLTVELGASLDVLLVVLILGVLVARLQAEVGTVDVAELRELHD